MTRLFRPGRWAISLLLAIACGVVSVQLWQFVGRVRHDGLQMDFATMYVAGKSLNRGVSPYVNWVLHSPDLWDGSSHMRHSGFLWPPLAARFFQPLATLPYMFAKRVWTTSVVAAAIASFWLTWWLVRGISLNAVLLCSALALLSGPLYAVIERGQIDTMTGMLLLVAAVLATRAGPGRSIAAGLCLALATILKMHVIYLVPMLLLRRSWSIVAAYAAWGCVLLGVMLAVCGIDSVKTYVTVDLPRIARYGPTGTPDMLLGPADVPANQPVPSLVDGTVDGHKYESTVSAFAWNATVVRLICPQDESLQTTSFTPAIASMTVYVAAMAVVTLMLRKRLAEPQDDLKTISSWYLMLAITLFAAPLTWGMNAVWLSPIGLVWAGWWRRLPSLTWSAKVSWWIGVAAMLLIVFPEHHFPDDVNWWPLARKYVFGEALSAIALIGVLYARPLKAVGQTAAPIAAPTVSAI